MVPLSLVGEYLAVNRHLKVAFVVAPFLLIGGYIIADYFQTSKERDYLEARGPQFDAYELKLVNGCEPAEGECRLVSGNLNLKLSVSGGRYRVVSSHVLDNVTMGLAQEDRESRAQALTPHEGQRQWSTPVRRLTNLKMDKPLYIRMVAKSNDIQYYAQIPVDPSGPWK